MRILSNDADLLTQAQPDSLMSIKITRRHLYEVASLAKPQQQLHQQSRQAKERMLLEHEQNVYTMTFATDRLVMIFNQHRNLPIRNRKRVQLRQKKFVQNRWHSESPLSKTAWLVKRSARQTKSALFHHEHEKSYQTTKPGQR